MRSMKRQLFELQDNDKEAKALRAASLLEDWKDVKRVLQYQGLLYVSDIIYYKIISCHHNDPLAEHFGINETWELIGRKYYWPSLKKDVEAYMKGCGVCLASKAVRYKLYRDLQSLPIPIYR